MSEPLGQSGDPVLHRWERWTDSEGGVGVREISVDVRIALADALLGYDVPATEVTDEFFRLVLDPNYEVVPPVPTVGADPDLTGSEDPA